MGFVFQTMKILEYGFQITDYGFWFSDYGFQFLDYGFWISKSKNCNLKSAVFAEIAVFGEFCNYEV